MRGGCAEQGAQAFADFFSTLTSLPTPRGVGQTGCAAWNDGSEEAYDRHRVFAWNEPLHIDVG